MAPARAKASGGGESVRKRCAGADARGGAVLEFFFFHRALADAVGYFQRKETR
jgi:hypothetical protein